MDEEDDKLDSAVDNDENSTADEDQVKPNLTDKDDESVDTLPKMTIPSTSSPQSDQVTTMDPKLQQALDQQSKQHQYATLLRGFQQILQGAASGSGFKANMDEADSLDKNAAEPVENYKTQVAQEASAKKAAADQVKTKAETDLIQQKLEKSKLDFTDQKATNDPASPQSAIAQDVYMDLAKKNGTPYNEDTVRQTSGATLYKLTPEMQKALHDYYTNQNEQAKRDTQLAMNKENNATRRDVAGQRAEDRANAQSDKQDVADQKFIDKDTEALKKDLDPNQARAGNMAKSQAVVNSAERLEALFQQFPDGNIPKSQTSELANGVAGLINGGTAQSQHQINQIVPSTLVGNAAGIAEWLTNEPTGQQQQAFVKLLQESTGREKTVAKDQVKAAQIQRLSAHRRLKDLSPDDYNAQLASAGIDPEADIDEKGRYVKGGMANKVLVRDPQGNIRSVNKKDVAAATDPKRGGGTLVNAPTAPQAPVQQIPQPAPVSQAPVAPPQAVPPTPPAAPQPTGQ